MDRAQHRHHVAADFSVGPKFNIPQHGDHIAVDLAVDIVVAQDRDRVVRHRTGHVGAAEHRDHVYRLAVAARGTKNRHDCVGLLSDQQMAAMADAHQVAIGIVATNVMAPRAILPFGAVAGTRRLRFIDEIALIGGGRGRGLRLIGRRGSWCRCGRRRGCRRRDGFGSHGARMRCDGRHTQQRKRETQAPQKSNIHNSPPAIEGRRYNA